ncbi:unnamed protein product [Prorocentrum cordatum]|uniref:Ubiquitin-like domain-containing protein n=1 Tax=Prorocentrum cordatum TaxID=2364126 RepID=A0ABN9UBY7_9DINO|nr:unnamed protein product [Polarella glacialis]
MTPNLLPSPASTPVSAESNNQDFQSLMASALVLDGRPCRYTSMGSNNSTSFEMFKGVEDMIEVERHPKQLRHFMDLGRVGLSSRQLVQKPKPGDLPDEPCPAWHCCWLLAAAARLRACEGRSPWDGKHPEPKSRVDIRKITAIVKLAAPVRDLCRLDCTPSTKISYVVDRIIERHGGSISDLSVCVNRFHPEEIVARDKTLEQCGVFGGDCIIYYDFVPRAGALLQ